MIRAALIIFFFPGLLAAQFSRLSPVDPVENGLFGHSVALDGSGSIALVGSPGANIRDDIEDFSGTAYIFNRDGDQWVQSAKLVPSEIRRNEAFGWAAALSRDGRIAVVGAPLASATPSQGYAAGAVYVFSCTNADCEQEALLVPPVRVPGDLFGMSVAVDESGSSIVIGAPGANNHTGIAWLFRRSGDQWAEGVQLLGEALDSYASFGWSVATNSDGSTVWIGSPLDEREPETRGAVYVYMSNPVSIDLQTILHPEAPSTAMFGYEVGLAPDASVGLIGSPGVNHDASSFGSAVVFSNSGAGWERGERLISPNPIESAWFGSSASLNDVGTLVVVGAPGDGRNGFRTGRAFVFAAWRGVWTLVRELEPDSAASDDRFGFSTALDGAADQAIVGARESPVNEFDAGLAFSFGPSFLPVRNGGDEVPVFDSDRFGQHAEIAVFPNPCAGHCRLSIKTSQLGAISLDAFDLQGRRITRLFEGVTSDGEAQVDWNPSGLPPGIYIFQLKSASSGTFGRLVHVY